MPHVYTYNVQSVFAQVDDINYTTLSGLSIINRVQSCNIAINYPYQNEFGWDGGGDQVMVERPRVGMELNYYPTKGANEVTFGLHTGVGNPALMGIVTREQNYFVVANKQYYDNLGFSGNNWQIFALGNGVITNYSVNARIAQPLSSSFDIENFNLLIQTGGSVQNLPTINKETAEPISGHYHIPEITTEIRPQSGIVTQINTGDIQVTFYDSQDLDQYWVPVIRPGDISLSFDSGSSLGMVMSGQNSCSLQSFAFSIALPRTDMQRLGWNYPESRPLQFPITVNITAEAYMNDAQVDALNKAGMENGHSISLICKKRGANDSSLEYHFTNAKLQNQNVTAQIGAFNRVSFNWSSVIYDMNTTGPNDANFYFESDKNVFDSPNPDLIALLFIDPDHARISWGDNYNPTFVPTPYPQLQVTV